MKQETTHGQEQEYVVGEVVEYYRPHEKAVLPPDAAQLAGEEKRSRRNQRKRKILCGILILLGLTVAIGGALIWLWPRWYASVYGPMPEEAGYLPRDTQVHLPVYEPQERWEMKIEDGQGNTLTPQEIYAQVNPSVVTVQVQLARGGGVSTGIIISEDGYILTNHHVVQGAYQCWITLPDYQSYEASYVAGDIGNDLAILKVEAENLPVAEIGSSDALLVGDTVYAIGNPLGVELRGTFTDGIVSAINRDVEVDGHTMTLIQTNAALNIGNSGGPLINVYGQVVGINTIKMRSDFSAVEGLGFAIPTSSVQYMVSDLLEYGEVKPDPKLGISVKRVGTTLPDGTVGILVQELQPGCAGERAGVRVGDYLLAADGEATTSSADLLRIRRRFNVGDTMELLLWRDGKTFTVTLELNEEFLE